MSAIQYHLYCPATVMITVTNSSSVSQSIYVSYVASSLEKMIRMALTILGISNLVFCIVFNNYPTYEGYYPHVGTLHGIALFYFMNILMV